MSHIRQMPLPEGTEWTGGELKAALNLAADAIGVGTAVRGAYNAWEARNVLPSWYWRAAPHVASLARTGARYAPPATYNRHDARVLRTTSGSQFRNIIYRANRGRASRINYRYSSYRRPFFRKRRKRWYRNY